MHIMNYNNVGRHRAVAYDIGNTAYVIGSIAYHVL